MDFKNKVIQSAQKKVLFTRHALEQMNKPERLIQPKEIESVIFEGKIIEDYPNDERGHSCLIAGFGEGRRPMHVVCSPKDDYLAVITAYIPIPEEWGMDFMKRRR